MTAIIAIHSWQFRPFPSSQKLQFAATTVALASKDDQGVRELLESPNIAYAGMPIPFTHPDLV
jgi:hypothetical protein